MAGYKIGDRVKWSVGRGGKRRTFTGKVVSKNPRIAPGVKYGVRVKGETYYPVVKLSRATPKRRTR